MTSFSGVLFGVATNTLADEGGDATSNEGGTPPYASSKNRCKRETNPQGFIALLHFVPTKLKSLKPQETHFEPHTLGEHIRCRRLEMKHTQKELATRLGVVSWTITNWEKGHTEPPIASIPAIIGFLGYDPFPEPKTVAEHLLAKRRAMGWSIEQAAGEIGVDPGSWSNWERGQTVLYRQHRIHVASLLNISAFALDKEMSARWNQLHKRTPVSDSA